MTLKFKKEDVVRALRDANGLMAVAAKRLGCTRQTVYNAVRRFKLEEELKQARESMKDFAESQLQKNIKAGKEASVFFFLKTQAKDRGYIERQELTGVDGDYIRIVVKDENS